MQFYSFLGQLLGAIAGQVKKDVSESLGLFFCCLVVVWFGLLCLGFSCLEALCQLFLHFGDPKMKCFRGALTST